MPAFVRTGGRGDTDKGKASRTLSPPTPPPLWPRIRTGPSSPTSGTGKVVPGTSWWWCTVPAEDAQEGVGGMARRNSTLSFRHGNWSLAVPLPLPQGNTIPGRAYIPPPCLGRGKECPLAAGCLATLTGHRVHTKPAEPGLSAPRRRGRCAEIGDPAFTTVSCSSRLWARWQQQFCRHLAGPVGWLWGQGARRATSLPCALPLAAPALPFGGQEYGVLLPRGVLCPLGIRRCHHRAGP